MTNTLEFLSSLIQGVPTTNYWLVHGRQVKCYYDSSNNGIIKIGYDKIPLQILRDLSDDDELASMQLMDYIESCTPLSYWQAKSAVSLLIPLSRHVMPGDIVVFPKLLQYPNNDEIAICRVTGDIYEEPDYRYDGTMLSSKRIPIRVELLTNRRSLPPKFQLLLYSQQKILDITKYSSYIDTIDHNYYRKEGIIHLLLKINTDADVDASTFYNINRIFNLVDGFCKENGISGCASDVTLKVLMESKGRLHLTSKNRFYLTLFALTIFLVNGAHLKYETNETKFEASSEGIIKNYSDFLDRQQDRETLKSIKNSLDSLKIETPEDFKSIIDLYKTRNESREKY